MQFHDEFEDFGWRAFPVTLCVACSALLFLSAPESGRCAAIMVKQNINLNGNSVTVDSYNSGDTNKSINGQWAASVSGDAGDVICIGGITNSVSIGNANIYGRVYVGSGTSVNIGASGAVGTHAWIDIGNTGIEPGYLVANANFSFPNISLPDYSEFLTPAAGTVVTTNSGVSVTNSYDAVIGGGNYTSTSGLGNTIVTYPSTLVLPNGYSIANLTIVPGASLTVYAGGTSIIIGGNQIVNQSGLPGTFIVYGTSDVTAFAYAGNSPFSGVLILPSANVQINGAGNNTVDISGTIIAKSLTFNGHVSVHFDEALIQQGIIPSLAARLASPAVSGSGQFQFNVSGVPGLNYAIETSTDLINWVPVFTNTSPFTFTDTNASPLAQSFYRAVYHQQ